MTDSYRLSSTRQGLLLHDVLQCSLDAGHLGSVALVGGRLRRVGVDLGGRGVGRVGHAGAEPEAPGGGDGDDALLGHLLPDDEPVHIRGGNVSHLARFGGDGAMATISTRAC